MQGTRLILGQWLPGRRAALSAGLALALAIAVAGCTTPVGADRTTLRRGYAQVNANALQGKLSDISVLVLHRYAIQDEFDSDPGAALAKLHKLACSDSRRDLLLGLSDLSYYHAEQLRRSVKPGAARGAQDYYLASAIYAWIYMFRDGADQEVPLLFDRRMRVACDLYSHALARAFAPGGRTNSAIMPRAGTYQTAGGPVRVDFSKTAFKWDLSDIEAFLPADEYLVRGLAVRDRQAGIGTPLIVVGKILDKKTFARRFPATLLLRADGDVNAWSQGKLQLTLELYSTFEHQTVEIAGRQVPLEGDLTAPMAYGLNDDKIWRLGSQQFFSSEEKIRSNIYLTQPYTPGKIPVIFVHGTFSSPVWWAEMWNTLRADPVLRERYQFWNFIYNSGNPVTYSAAHLRDMINRKVSQLDPNGTDPAMTNMVVIGHSQGGLLSKLTVTDTGDALWNAVSEEDFDALDFDTTEARNAVRRNFFFTPLPSVQRVVFIATPHRGSYLASSFIRSFARRFMTFPKSVVDTTTTLLKIQGKEPVPSEVSKTVVTSLDQMSPNDKLLNALAAIPVAPGKKSHSIIGVKGDGPPREGGDGVVKYVSAHVDYADSELVVRHSHSCQDEPDVIEEVRRILLEHLVP